MDQFSSNTHLFHSPLPFRIIWPIRSASLRTANHVHFTPVARSVLISSGRSSPGYIFTGGLPEVKP